MNIQNVRTFVKGVNGCSFRAVGKSVRNDACIGGSLLR